MRVIVDNIVAFEGRLIPGSVKLFGGELSIEVLTGNAAGVEIKANSNSPGGSIDVKIRGISSLSSGSQPLYVVDGIPLTGDISFLESNNIQSIEVLKDASAAAIYGSRGANGVILVATKKGAKNQLKIDAEATFAFQSPLNMPEMANATEYANIMNAIIDNDGSISSKIENPQSLQSTNWLDEITQTAPINKYSIALRGGGENVTYASNLNYLKQEGIIKGSDFERINGHFFAEYDKNKLKVGHNIFLTYEERNAIDGEENLYGGLMINALSMDPITPVYKSKEEFDDPILSPNKNEYSVYKHAIYSGTGNPVAQIARTYNPSNNLKALANLYASYNIIDGLVFKTSFGLEAANGRSTQFVPDFHMAPNEFSSVRGVAKSSGTNLHYTWENTLSFDKSFDGGHNLKALAGYTSEHEKGTSLWGTTINQPANAEGLRYLSLGTSGYNTGDGIGESSLISYLGRVNYNYKSKYLVTATVRADGSSRFASGNKWGIFPSVSGAWNVKEEDFLNVDMISQLKLRAGWGTIGNQNIPGNATYTVLRNDKRYPFGNDHTLHPGFGLQSPGNADLVWETTEDINIGVDLGLFDQKLSFNLDWYKREVKDLLLIVPLASFLGMADYGYNLGSGAWANAGNMENTGFDMVVNYKDQIREFRYAVGANASFNKNEITKLNNVDFILSANYYGMGETTRTTVGNPAGNFYGFLTDGIFQSQSEVDNNKNSEGKVIQPNAKPGDFKFVDTDGNGEINGNDKDYIGNGMPTFTYGFNLKLEYKGFDLSSYFYGVTGNEIMDGMRKFNGSSPSGRNSRAGTYAAAWTPENKSNTQPRLTNLDQNGNYSQFSDYYVVDGSYFKCNNITLGYQFNKNICEKLKLSKLRLYVSVQNAFIITDYEGFDPAVSGGALSTGIDNGAYPMTRTITSGLAISF